MILLGLGANLPSRFGSPEQTLKAAMGALEGHGVRILKSSSIWLSAPVPISDQPWYHNMVVSVCTSLVPKALLELLKRIECDFGRENAEINAPRVIDIDVLAYYDVIFSDKSLKIPHERMNDRKFVLFPLREVDSSWVHPVSEESLNGLIEALPEGQEIKILKNSNEGSM